MMMTGSAVGVSLDQIQQAFDVGVRTAERMRDAALRLLPDVEEYRDDEGRKRWRASELPRGMPALSAGDVASLQAAADMMENAGRHEQAATLRRLADMLLALQSAAARRRIEPDLELLMEAEGMVHRVGPVVKVAPDVLRTIRDAILRSTVLRIAYLARGRSRPQLLDIEPYGILHGIRSYLVGKGVGMPDYRHFRLNGIGEIALTNTPFVRDPAFDLTEYRCQFFGSFREPPVDNVWRFKPEVAGIAAEYLFHPKQTSERLDDGSLVVRFRAGGRQEMAWHLMTWGDGVEIILPDRA
jgi:predicted DNA-binding transcriptional regulator YafY